MKKVQYQQYGGAEVIQMNEVDKPVPAATEVLIKVKAAGINELDWKIRNGDLKITDGKGFPKAMGCELAGIVEAVGDQVQDFKADDEVLGWLPFDQLGAYADFALVTQEKLIKKPTSLHFKQAAALPMVGATARQVIALLPTSIDRKRVLINGASGGVGHIAVQLAKGEGAHVTGVVGTHSIPFAEQIGVDEIIDYHKTDITKSERKFDLILDTSKKLPFNKALSLLSDGGIYVDLQPSINAFMGSFFHNAFSTRKRKVLGVVVKKEDLEALAEAVEKDHLIVEVGKT
ncbi:MAG: NAD(P)-dependent alcohol dehydrogenase, partial [Bacteroidota bacterium]